MALQKALETKSGISIANAYLKIVEQSGDKTTINLRVRPFVSKEKADLNLGIEGEDIIVTFTPLTVGNSANFIEQGYEHLKTLDAFKDAVDC